MDNHSTITFVIPCYNEAARLATTERELLSFFQDHSSSAKVIFVNDGSTDNTKEVIQRICSKINKVFPIVEAKCVSYSDNKGKGWALYQGITATGTDWCLTLDADMSAKPSEVIRWINEGNASLQHQKVFVASREEGIKKGMVKSTLTRRVMGICFNKAVQILAGIRINDTQCGFKLYPKKIAQKAFSELSDYGFAHDVEVLIKLKQEKVDVEVLPIKWAEVSGSKVNLVKDSIKMLLQVIKYSFKYRSKIRPNPIKSLSIPS